MDGNAVGALVAVAGFAIAFVVAKWVSTRIRKRRQVSAEARAAGLQSRQVRRAQARRRSR